MNVYDVVYIMIDESVGIFFARAAHNIKGLIWRTV